MTISSSELEEMYYERDMSLADMGKELGVTPRTVGNWMEDAGISRLSKEEACRNPDADPKVIALLYHEEDMSARDVADELSVAYRTVLYQMQVNEISRRDRIKASKLKSARGGRHQRVYGPGWNEAKREACRDRYGRACFICNRSDDEHVSEYGCKLHVHHVTPARQVDDAKKRNALDNLVPLCAPCHARVEHGSLEVNK